MAPQGNGVIRNLVMREWESYFSGEYGWPRYCEYRHALMPHRGNLSNVDRIRAAEGFGQQLITVLGRPQPGNLPERKGFITVSPASAQILAFRKKNGSAFELRVAEVEGKKSKAAVELALAVNGASETNLLGHKTAEVARTGNRLDFEIKPWRVHTFEVT